MAPPSSNRGNKPRGPYRGQKVTLNLADMLHEQPSAMKPTATLEIRAATPPGMPSAAAEALFTKEALATLAAVPGLEHSELRLCESWTTGRPVKRSDGAQSFGVGIRCTIHSEAAAQAIIDAGSAFGNLQLLKGSTYPAAALWWSGYTTKHVVRLYGVPSSINLTNLQAGLSQALDGIVSDLQVFPTPVPGCAFNRATAPTCTFVADSFARFPSEITLSTGNGTQRAITIRPGPHPEHMAPEIPIPVTATEAPMEKKPNEHGPKSFAEALKAGRAGPAAATAAAMPGQEMAPATTEQGPSKTPSPPGTSSMAPEVLKVLSKSTDQLEAQMAVDPLAAAAANETHDGSAAGNTATGSAPPASEQEKRPTPAKPDVLLKRSAGQVEYPPTGAPADPMDEDMEQSDPDVVFSDAEDTQVNKKLKNQAAPATTTTTPLRDPAFLGDPGSSAPTCPPVGNPPPQ